MTSDEENLFLEEMADVVPLRREPRVRTPGAGQPPGDPSLEQRRRAAVQEEARDRNILTEEGIAPLDPWYVLAFKLSLIHI